MGEVELSKVEKEWQISRINQFMSVAEYQQMLDRIAEAEREVERQRRTEQHKTCGESGAGDNREYLPSGPDLPGAAARN